jgi:hypothetical protein
MLYKMEETREDQWTIYRRVWFWWRPIMVRSGFERAVAAVRALKHS